jgi:hypothetical protein
VKKNTKENKNSNASANQALQKKSDGVSLQPPSKVASIQKKNNVVQFNPPPLKRQGAQANLLAPTKGDNNDIKEAANEAHNQGSDALKAGASVEAVAAGDAANAVLGGAAGIFDNVKGMKDFFLKGKTAFEEKDKASAADAFLEGAKLASGIADTAGKLGETSIKTFATTSALIPGIGAGISAFQNVMKLMKNQDTWEKIELLEQGGNLNESDQQVIGAYISRLNAKFTEELVDFIFNLAEVIAAFAGPAANSGVAMAHSCVNAFKGACKLYYSYKTSKGIQADKRVAGDGDLASRDTYKDFDSLISANPDQNNIKDLVLWHQKRSEFRDNLINLDSEDSNYSEQSANLKRYINLLEDKIKHGVNKYNAIFSPETPIDGNTITELAKIHKNVISKIITQSNTEKIRYQRFKHFIFGNVGKLKAQEALKAVYPGDVSPEDVKISEIEKAGELDYFWDKTKDQIKIAANRTWFSDQEITDNLATLLKDNKAKFLDSLIEGSPGLFNENMRNNNGLYIKAVDEFIEKINAF